MALRNLCFEVEAGTPTLTIELPGSERMLPWSSFIEGERQEDSIRLCFADWNVVLKGLNLGELWREFQLQDVRTLRALNKVEEGECLVENLEVHPKEKPA